MRAWGIGVKRTSVVVGASALAFSVLAGAAYAEPAACKLNQIAAMDMIREPDGAIAVAAGVNGAQHRFLVQTAGSHSVLLHGFADSAQIPQKAINERTEFYTFRGKATKFGNVDNLTLGSGTANGLNIIIAPGSYSDDPEVVGVLGIDLLANFDVEFDFAAGRINLFSGDHCPGLGAYWAARYAELPIDLQDLGKPTATWMLDSQPVTVTFSTDATGSSMPFNVAKSKFGLDVNSPGLEPAGTDAEGRPVYQYRFKLLTAEGVTINNPLVRLHGAPDDELCTGGTRMMRSHIPGVLEPVRCTGMGDLALGLRELSKLHLYFAFKQNKLYFTAADAH